MVRLAMAVFLAMEITRLDKKRFRSRVALPLLIGAGIQSVISILQVATGGPLGLGTIGERAALVVFDESVAAQGTTIHPYVLAGFSVLAATVAIAVLPRQSSVRRWWLFGIALAAVPIGLTYARTGAVGFVFVLIALVVGAIRFPQRYRAATLALAAGALIPALLFSGGWSARVEQSATTDLNANSSDRIILVEQSFELMADSPVVGVGPGRYETVLEAGRPRVAQVVHVVPLLIAAENGIYAGLVSLAFFLIIGWRALRTSPAAVAIVAGLGIWMVLDKFTYAFPSGIAMFAIWLGTLDWLAVRRATSDA
jgi:O-antigen ligase